MKWMAWQYFGEENTCRMKVFKGWIVRVTYSDYVACTFISDPHHEWKLEE